MQGQFEWRTIAAAASEASQGISNQPVPEAWSACESVNESIQGSSGEKGPIQVKWVGVNMGDEENPEYRSRLVAKDI